MAWVAKQKDINGPRARRERGQSSRSEEWTAHEGPSSFQRDFLGQMDNRGEERASRVDLSFLQRDGLGHLDNRPKAVGEEGQPSLAAKYISVEQASDDGPSSFQKDGLGRLDHSPKVAGGEGQPILATVWAPLAYKPPWDEPHIRLGLRLAFCKLRSGSPKRN